MIIEDKDIWMHLVDQNNLVVLDLLSEAEKGSLKGKKIIYRKPFSNEFDMNEAIIKYFESKGVVLIKKGDKL